MVPGYIPGALFEEHASSIMGEDFGYQIRSATTSHSTTSLDCHIKSYVLIKTDRLLKNFGYNLAHFFSLPEPIV
jgi:hypothetical protein